jgi:hypothetical protein
MNSHSPNESGAEPGSSGAQGQPTPPNNHNGGKKSMERKGRKRRVSKLLAVVASMPPRRHWPRRPKPFDIADSEIIQWAIRQRRIQQWLFGKFQEFDLIKFDRATGTWRGCAYSGEAPEHSAGDWTAANSREEVIGLLRHVVESLESMRDLQNEHNHLLQPISVQMP